MKKLAIIIPAAVVGSLALAIAIPFTIFGIRSASLNKDYSYLKNDATYSQEHEIEDVELVKQHISCGYATIEMMSNFYGNKVTEDELSEKNGGAISTQTTNGFYNELKATIPDKQFVKYAFLENDAFLKQICVSLANNNPVAIEWAAKYEEEWTLHFSLVTGIDIKEDVVTVQNPYGYVEEESVEGFLSRTTFNAYENMPGFLNFGFAYGAFHKNALFYAL